MEEKERRDNKEVSEDPEGDNRLGGEDAGAEVEDFKKLYEASLRTIEEGDILKGVVMAVDDEYVTVDIGYKSEGQIPISEFRDQDGDVGVGVDDEIDVLLEKKEDDDGLITLSKEKADKLKAWRSVSKAFREGEIVDGTITSRIKGGLTVDIGINAFLPGSQVDIRPVRNLDKFIGKRFKFRVIKFNKKRSNIVLSRRALLEEERKVLRGETLKHLREGEILEGVVKNITDYGAFVDLGGIDGLLHITDISWGRINHPSEKLSVGERIKVKVLNFDRERERVSLGLKQISPDPWEEVKEKYPLDSQVEGRVVSITDYGAFVELGEGVEGLVHISEMSWTKKIKHPSQVVDVGDIIEAVVLDVDVPKKRISLGMRQVEPNPWALIEEKYPVGTRVKGKVKTITDFGVFVGFDEGIDGLIHISEMSWAKKVKDPAEMYEKGQEIEAVVLNIDRENERFSLGIKQLTEDPWEEIPKRYHIGDRVEGKVTNITDFGVFIQLEDGIEGLIHVSELSKEKVENASDVVEVGEPVSAMVINVDSKERKIGLSVKSLKEKDEKEEVEKYMAAQKSATPSLGRLIQEEMEKKAKKEEKDKGQEAEGPTIDVDETPSNQGTQGEA
ncbi:MAG: 30S ribosomal protein S1 [Syntrophobacterales bacterium]|nr:MAG: 30S ribosomal protein S1 [Syntrophobacterales bacterium]